MMSSSDTVTSADGLSLQSSSGRDLPMGKKRRVLEKQSGKTRSKQAPKQTPAEIKQSGQARSTRAPKQTPAEIQLAEEAAAKVQHVQGVKQLTAVTKMSTRLVARRRALTQVEMQTNWIAKAVFSAASRAGPLSLNLLGCDVNNSAAIRLATTLATSNIKTLNLTFNRIGDVGVKAIAKALIATPALNELGLGSNLITDHGAAELAKALQHQSSCVTFLNVSGNMIGNCGAAALGVHYVSSCVSVASAPTLFFLAPCGNDRAFLFNFVLTAIVLSSVQTMLEVNPSLVEICLDSNYIGLEGKDALMDGGFLLLRLVEQTLIKIAG